MTRHEDLEVTLVRRAAPAVPPLSDAGRHAVRERLREAAGRRRRRRLVLGVLLPAGAALAVAAVVVAAFMVVPAVKDGRTVTGGQTVPVTPEAIALTRAAERLRAVERQGTGIPNPRPDQYVYTRDVLWEYPRDGGRRLVFRNESWRSVDGRKKSLIGERHNVMVAPARKHPDQPWPPSQYEGLRALPLDPRKLIEAAFTPFHDMGPKPPLEKMSPRDVDDVHLFLLGLLRYTGRTPPGLRPAALEALACVPGIRVDVQATDILGRPGFSIGRKTDILGDYRLIFDRRTFAFLGFYQKPESRDGSKPVVHRFALVEWGVTDRPKRRPATLIKP